jgi:hypothetical protein
MTVLKKVTFVMDVPRLHDERQEPYVCCWLVQPGNWTPDINPGATRFRFSLNVPCEIDAPETVLDNGEPVKLEKVTEVLNESI